MCGGLSDWTGRPASLFRCVFVALAVLGGSGLALYVLGWLFIPRSGSSSSIGRRAAGDREALGYAVAFATGLAGLLLAFDALGLSFASNLVWPNWIAAAGLVVIWRVADDDEKADIRELVEQAPIVGVSSTHSKRATAVRIASGGVLVIVGLTGLVATRHPTFATFRALCAAAAVILGFLIAFGPWWLRLARDLADERRERVRSQERADMAAHVHDSVLQTLALIQRSAANPAEVTRLARVQERELRAWLFDGRSPGSFDAETVHTIGEGVSAVQLEVEDQHRISVESVVVGDCPLDDDLRALLAAGREAVVNAAKWSGANSVSIYVEVEPSRVSMYVRDRGAGFDADAVDGSRRGIAESIRARMERHGGTSEIRSEPGEGTEVELVLPRHPASK